VSLNITWGGGGGLATMSLDNFFCHFTSKGYGMSHKGGGRG
jgi:hypothetical protein